MTRIEALARVYNDGIVQQEATFMQNNELTFTEMVLIYKEIIKFKSNIAYRLYTPEEAKK